MSAGAVNLVPTQQVLFDAISAAAARGEPCPGNDDLAYLLGTSSASTVVAVIKRLEDQGVIRVNRFGQGREVQIVGTGQVTAYLGPREPHWRYRDQPLHDFGPAIPHATSRPASRFAPMDNQPRVTRDPCPRCGVRADFGCAHRSTA